MNYTGVIIGESLQDREILLGLNIRKTMQEAVTPEHRTPWLKAWTLYTVEIPEEEADVMAEAIAEALEEKHPWYADFKNDTWHFIVYRDRVFKAKRTSKKDYDEAKAYGLALGIPAHQMDFHPEVK